MRQAPNLTRGEAGDDRREGVHVTFSAVEVVAITRAPNPGELQRKDRNTPGTLDQDGISRSDPASARQCYPGGHCGAGQSGGFLEGQVAWQKHDCFLIED